MDNSATKQIALSAVNVAIIALSAQIQIPITPPITLQLAVIFFICGFFSFKIAFLSITTYLLAGFIGLPVFCGFQGGATVIMGATGGFLVSFLLFPFIFLLAGSNSVKRLVLCYILSLIVCYIFGFLWLNSYLKSSYTAFTSILIFIPADIIKGIFSAFLTVRLNKTIKNKIE